MIKRMDYLFEHYKKTGYLHHAHVIEGVYGDVLQSLLFALEKNLGVDMKNNPDLVTEYYELLGVDEARGFKEAQSRTSFEGTRKFFIIGANSFTHEAQNAFLKTFEEPTLDTHFFLIIPRLEILLPTLRSRVAVVSANKQESSDEAKGLAEKFLDVPLEDRFVMIKKMTEKKGDEPLDREMIRRFVDHLERILYTRNAGNMANIGSGATIFREIFGVKTYLTDRGSSPKMLLDHLAIVVDNTKN